VAVPKVPPLSAVGQLSEVLDSPEIAALVSELEATRWTGRPGYPIRGMVGMALAKSVYAVPTWTRTVALVREHAALRAAVTLVSGDVPSVYACYRFAVKLRTYSDMLDRCIAKVVAGLHAEHPNMGTNIAVDGSDMPAYANGQRFVRKGGPERERFFEPLRSLDPLAWRTWPSAPPPAARARGFKAETAAMDKGYDVRPVYEGCEERDCRPIIPLRHTVAVERGDHRPPTCEHGEWRFAGSDSKRGASKSRCRPASASPRRFGSRLPACIRSSRATRPGSPLSTGVARPSSASSGA